MQLKALLLPVLAAGALASPQRPGWWHPRPTSTCLTDAAATSLAEAFSSMLTNPDRSAANATGQAIIADGYSETSDSILSLEHEPLGTVTFAGKQFYLKNVVNAPPIPAIATLDIVHDCTKIVWYWVATGLGKGTYEVKGFNLMYTTNAGTQIIDNYVEFNSLAWGADIHNTAVNMTTTL